MIEKLRIYDRPWNAGVYLLAAAALVIDAWVDTVLPLVFIAGLFLIWDIGYVRNPAALTARDPRRFDDLVTTSRTYMSWYMLFFVVFFGLMLTGDAQSREAFVDLCSEAGVSLPVLLSPLVIMSTSFLFIPIHLGNPDHSPALKALFVVVIFSQKMSILILLHCLIRLTLATGRLAAAT